jgi:mono/diheme cytochrome c family protein
VNRNRQESFLLGLIAGAVVSFSAVMLLSLLPIFDLDDEEEAVTATPPPSSESTAETADSGIAGPGRGVGGPPEGRGPGSGGMGTADPLAYGTASPVVMEAFEAGACASCHSIKGVGGGGATIGPPLFRTGALAVERRPGPSPAAYIEESILKPNEFIMPNCPTGPCPEGVMPQNFAETLTPDQIATMVEYLAALGTAAEADVLAAP